LAAGDGQRYNGSVSRGTWHIAKHGTIAVNVSSEKEEKRSTQNDNMRLTLGVLLILFAAAQNIKALPTVAMVQFNASPGKTS
jgi:hypothetical protein